MTNIKINSMSNKLHLLQQVLSIILVLSFVVDYVRCDYKPSTKILFNCGGPPNSIDLDGRNWTTDVGSKYAYGKSYSATSAIQKPSVPQVPYMTARVFEVNFTYTFPVAPGHKFIRLYFYPETYNNLNASAAEFSVYIGLYTLLRNFRPKQTTEALNYDFIIKEYSVNVQSNTLNVTFAPAPNAPNSFAFINGIEIVSHGNIYNTMDGSASILGTTTQFYISKITALEKVYRLNVGGEDISPTRDTGMYRSWTNDINYIFGGGSGVTMIADPDVKITYPASMPSYVAPRDVYRTYRAMGPTSQVNIQSNLTWLFTVDSGFTYLVRLHFCEVIKNITSINQRVFDIYLNNRTAQKAADVIAWGNGKNGVPVYKDFIVIAPSGAGLPQQDLWLALHPNAASGSNYYDAILNGVEIFKVNDSTGSLAGLNPIPAPKSPIG